jgi:hypothetical protein
MKGNIHNMIRSISQTSSLRLPHKSSENNDINVQHYDSIGEILMLHGNLW